MNEDLSSDIIIHECQKHECTAKQKRTLMSLTFRGISGMRDAWSDIGKSNGERYYEISDHRIYIAYYGGKIIGWCLLFNEQGKYHGMFYVNRKYRRMKVGTTLLEHASKYCKKKRKKLFVFDEEPLFFSACGIPRSQWVMY